MPTTHGVKWRSHRMETIKKQRMFIQNIISQLASEDPNDAVLWKIDPYQRLNMMANWMRILVSTTEKAELEKRLDDILAHQHELEQLLSTMPGLGGEEGM